MCIRDSPRPYPIPTAPFPYLPPRRLWCLNPRAFALSPCPFKTPKYAIDRLATCQLYIECTLNIRISYSTVYRRCRHFTDFYGRLHMVFKCVYIHTVYTRVNIKPCTNKSTYIRLCICLILLLLPVISISVCLVCYVCVVACFCLSI